MISGPRGTMMLFKLATTANLRTSDYLFDKIGGGTSNYTTLPVSSGGGVGNAAAGNRRFKHIDTIIRVSGATTGYSVDIPVRFIKDNEALQSV